MRILTAFLEGVILGAIAGTLLDIFIPDLKNDSNTWWVLCFSLFCLLTLVYRIFIKKMFK